MATRIKQYDTGIQSDATLIVSTALGANNATTSTNFVDLGAQSPYPTTGKFVVQVAVTATANGANNKNVNISFQHCDDTNAANAVNIPELRAWVLAMTGGNIAANTTNVTLPPSAKRYVRITCATENAGGAPNDATATLKLLF